MVLGLCHRRPHGHLVGPSQLGLLNLHRCILRSSVVATAQRGNKGVQQGRPLQTCAQQPDGVVDEARPSAESVIADSASGLSPPTAAPAAEVVALLDAITAAYQKKESTQQQLVTAPDSCLAPHLQQSPLLREVMQAHALTQSAYHKRVLQLVQLGTSVRGSELTATQLLHLYTLVQSLNAGVPDPEAFKRRAVKQPKEQVKEAEARGLDDQVELALGWFQLIVRQDRNADLSLPDLLSMVSDNREDAAQLLALTCSPGSTPQLPAETLQRLAAAFPARHGLQ